MSDTDKTCPVTIHNVLGWELDPVMLEAVMARLSRHIPQAKFIDVYPQERIPADAPAWKSPGRCEWIIRVIYRSGGELTLGALQRQPGPVETVEFHS